MRALSTFPQVYVYRGLVDFRKSIDGLSSVVESELNLKPFSGALFLFMHRRKNRIKILYWDKTGFALLCLCRYRHKHKRTKPVPSKNKHLIEVLFPLMNKNKCPEKGSWFRTPLAFKNKVS